ncbi:MAG: Spy/CpxP family protein refolding chaperone [Acidobacteria bacterium]|nr:Spy/CpxP family protein refolding chaperone [Acidobacteriota bacterium]
MPLKYRSIGVLSVALGIATLSTAAFAQDDKSKTPTTNAPDQVRKHDRQFGQGRFGKGQDGQFGGRGGHGMGPGGKFGRGGMFGRGFANLNLTDDQKAQIRSIRESAKPDKAVMDELRTIMQAGRDGTITDAQKARAKEIRESMGAKAKGIHEQILNVLTAEQKATLAKEREDMKQRRDEMRKRFEEHRKQRQATPPATTAKPADKPTGH